MIDDLINTWLRDWQLEPDHFGVKIVVSKGFIGGTKMLKIAVGAESPETITQFTAWDRPDINKILTEVIVFNKRRNITLYVAEKEHDCPSDAVYHLSSTMDNMVKGACDQMEPDPTVKY
ncbi:MULTISPECIES: hypothetical protein [Rhodomicrobium]|uniref:hypothetical protein n=1 Tax=Rhodomicrobium TaxID=1068 RepID=UPI000F73FE54|nr:MULTISPECIES: hypothetical protein [Rhodomicrobium]